MAEDCFYWNDQGYDSIDKGQYEKALSCFKKSLDVNENYLIAWHSIGNAYSKLGQYEKAIECYDKRLESDALDTGLLIQKGHALRKLGKLDDALKTLKKIIDIDQFVTAPWINMGVIYESQDQLEKAIECYDKALEIDPKHALAWNNKRIAYANQGQSQKADDCGVKAKELESNKTDTSPKSESLQFVLHRFNFLQQKFNVDKGIAEKAAYIYMKILEKKVFIFDTAGVHNFSKMYDWATICFHMAHLDEALPIDLEKLNELSKMSKEKILENTELLIKEFNLKVPKQE